MQTVFKVVEKVAVSDATVLITGETGTGKGLLAKALHKRSKRSAHPFVQVNCGAIPANLLESELFGHVKGAFTGAHTSRPGKFEIARGGSLFLDEIGDMTPELQVKILRVLEEKEFEPVGGCKTVRSDVRIIAATHRCLEEEVQAGRFREDLFYRLHVIPLAVPPLRERKADIPLLVAHFLSAFVPDSEKGCARVDNAAMEMLTRYPWPGNVRELKNLMERIAVLKDDGPVSPADLPETISGLDTRPVVTDLELTDEGICLNTAVSEFEKQLIAQSLEKARGVKNKAAKLLHLKRTTLVEKIKRYQLLDCAM